MKGRTRLGYGLLIPSVVVLAFVSFSCVRIDRAVTKAAKEQKERFDFDLRLAQIPATIREQVFSLEDIPQHELRGLNEQQKRIVRDGQYAVAGGLLAELAGASVCVGVIAILLLLSGGLLVLNNRRRGGVEVTTPAEP